MGDLAMEERVEAIERFRNGLEKVMVTTNLCARGIDIEQASEFVYWNANKKRMRSIDKKHIVYHPYSAISVFVISRMLARGIRTGSI